MEEQSTLARPYALAVFRLAQEGGNADLWSEMLHFLASVMADPLMVAIVGNPKVGVDRVADIVLDVCGGRLSAQGQNLVRVLARNRRLGLAGELARLYDQYRAAAEGRTRVEVTGAYEVNPKFRQMIADAMKRRLGGEVDIETRIDKSLIGGVVVRAGDLVIDASLRGRLRQLEAELGQARQTDS